MKAIYRFLIKRFSFILGILFSVTLIPMLAVARYDYPSGDDYRYSKYVHNALVHKDSIWMVLGAAGRTVALTYKEWQGTFSAIFVMSLQPAVFFENAYALVPYIMLGMLIFSTFKLLHTVLYVCLKEKKRMVAIVGVAMLFLSIQYLPSATEAFYWFNGSSYYTFFYSVMLLYIDTFILFIRTYDKRKAAYQTALLAFIAAILGGTNFVTALDALILGSVFVIYCFYRKRHKVLPVLMIMLIEFAGFIISALAPGNAVRQAKLKEMSFPLTIVFSLGQAGADIFRWSLGALAVFVILLPMLYRMSGRSRLKFEFPGLFLLCTFILFSAQNLPPYYAMGWGGEGRLRNIVYYSFVWLFVANTFYFLGWAQKRHPDFASIWWMKIRQKFRIKKAGKVAAGFAATAFIFALCNPFMLSHSSSWMCLRILLNGEARCYGKQMKERISLYEDPNVRDIKVPALTVEPSPLFVSDVSGNPKESDNVDIAQYYHKIAVIVKSVK